MGKRFRISMVARVAMLFVVVLMNACAPVEPGESVEGGEIDESNNGGRFELVMGEILAVRLPSNPSTGYGWEIDELDESILQQMGEADFESSVPDDPPPGTGGWSIFRFEAIGEGESELRLIYHRPWTDDPPDSIYTVQVVVH